LGSADILFNTKNGPATAKITALCDTDKSGGFCTQAEVENWLISLGASKKEDASNGMKSPISANGLYKQMKQDIEKIEAAAKKAAATTGGAGGAGGTTRRLSETETKKSETKKFSSEGIYDSNMVEKY
jgi:hypothetical protein